MARTRNAVKRQKVATVESALFNPDVAFQRIVANQQYSPESPSVSVSSF